MDPLFKFDEAGLLPAVAQDRLTGEVRMVAWMNLASIERTVATGKATFFSRSRQALWEKGETSGHALLVREMFIDCDGDTLLLLVDPEGPSCHTGQPSCFFRRLADGKVEALPVAPDTVLAALEHEIESRRQSTAAKSYTKSLLEAGVERIGDKVREEGDEFARALASETDERVVSEAADVLYHLMVGLAARGLGLRKVLFELARRRGVSGHAEKAVRTR
jgi:phosphoribosyl-AMP cyclohydrolase / phosphoribosyl-ATP pyrophosphohydrolase